MKTFFKSILAVAVCASLFVACSKDDTVSDPSNGRKVTMTVTASSELESASGSRTTYDPLTGKISWNETGEYLQVFETARLQNHIRQLAGRYGKRRHGEIRRIVPGEYEHSARL